MVMYYIHRTQKTWRNILLGQLGLKFTVKFLLLCLLQMPDYPEVRFKGTFYTKLNISSTIHLLKGFLYFMMLLFWGQVLIGHNWMEG